MAHKFAHVWTSYIYSFDEGEFKTNGVIDLRKIKDNGDLDDGEHHHGGTLKLKGKAKDDSVLELENERGDRYVGVKVFENDDGDLTIAGRLHLSDGIFVRGEILDQDDPPWVITKP
jgi:hypothetical protein